MAHTGQISGAAMTTETLETQIVDAYRIPCDGGDSGLGHPRVWLQIPVDTGTVTCPYCDKVFVHRDSAETE